MLNIAVMILLVSRKLKCCFKKFNEKLTSQNASTHISVYFCRHGTDVTPPCALNLNSVLECIAAQRVTYHRCTYHRRAIVVTQYFTRR